MNDLQSSVWTKIQNFSIDQGTPDIPFERRLARENGWSVGYARRVIDEYKKFLYLALFGGGPVCPSEQVDQAWHMHMTFTRSYWDRLCKDVLGMRLHHDPSGGGRAEDIKHGDMYARTKQAYAKAFGHEPPGDIWPSSSERFDRHACYRRVDTARVFIVPKRMLGQAALLAVSGVGVATATGCATLAVGGGGLIFAVIIGVVLLLLIAALIFRNRRSQSRTTHTSGCGAGGGCGGLFTPFWFGGSETGPRPERDGHHPHDATPTDGGGDPGPGDSGGGSDGGGDGGGGGGGDGGGGSGCGGGGCGGGD